MATAGSVSQSRCLGQPDFQKAVGCGWRMLAANRPALRLEIFDLQRRLISAQYQAVKGSSAWT
jgi:hypothetical protein